jgi:hypothetical protein
MRTLKIRFVEHLKEINTEPEFYNIQVKKWYGWKTLSFVINMGYGSIVDYYSEKTKEALLEKILDKVYRTTKKHIWIKEYPSIKKY